MTELNLLYGNDNLLSDERKEGSYSKISSQQLHQMALSNDGGSGGSSNEQQASQHSQQHSSPPQSQSMQVAQQQMAQQMANQQAQQMANQQLQQQMMLPTQQQQHSQHQHQQRKGEYNFIDRMNLKKTEVIKLALFSLVIVLGISIDRMLTHYLSRYINDNVLTDFQELLLRLSYPITIFLLLWIFKAI